MKKVVKIIDEEKNVGEYEVFCTFDSGLTNKSYILYTEYSEDKDGNILMHAGSYTKGEDALIVNKRLTNQENEMISTFMNSIIEQAKKENN